MNNRDACSLEPIQNPPTQTLSQSADIAPGRSGRFFRNIDWWALALTFLCVWAGYYLTLAPEVTLEDSGELATGSFYAGIPHPPGYPVWTLYTWVWTVLLPFKNVAWRVALGEATSGALAAGLLAMLVSRGSGLLIKGIADLKDLAGPVEERICLVSGFVAGMLLGFNGFMWSQSVIVEVYSFSVASFVLVLLLLLRWTYSPHRWRYLYLALFFHGVCFTNHQTLVVAAMGIEVVIAASSSRMGRYLFLGNSVLYLGGLILKQQHILTAWDENQAIFVIFNVVGIGSIACYGWFSWRSRQTALEFCLDGALVTFFISLASISALGGAGLLVGVAALGVLLYLAFKTRRLGLEWLVVIGCGCCWLLGAAFYFYMPLAGMSNPPMEWGYPRTVEGFIHAFTRGQYGKTNPTNILHDPLRFLTQLSMLGEGIIEEFNWVYTLLALLPFLFFFKMHKRERAWLIGVTAIYLCLGVLLLILLNPPPDRAAQQLVRVFFTASHTIIALLVGYALALTGAYLAAHYPSFRFWGLAGGGVAVALAIFSFVDLTSRTFFGETVGVGPGRLLSFTARALVDSQQFGLPVYAGLLLIGTVAVFISAMWRCRNRAPMTLVLVLFALMPVHSILTHWADNEQRNHWFGYRFGHDMFTPPVQGADGRPLYPQMTRNAILFGGTDPGRFCPTYMIFCDSFVPPRCRPAPDPDFDRRDVYIITQNALADGTYLEYLRAQYNRSAQVDPPFFQELLRSSQERAQNTTTNFLARMAEPLDRLVESLGAQIEKRRRTFTSWFKPSDFLDLPAVAARLRPVTARDPVSEYVYDRLSQQTQQLLANPNPGPALAEFLARDLNRLLEAELNPASIGTPVAGPRAEPLYRPERFRGVPLSQDLLDFLAQDPHGDTRIRLNRLLLEAAYPRALARSLGGVYPDREIYIPTLSDSGRAYNQYALDVRRRLELNQLKPGEDVQREGARVQITGTAAVMALNGLLAKVIFDRNPQREFFVEESFPLDWMYPHLTPYGIIMKINRQPVAELTGRTVQADHEFWSRYCAQFIGDWLNYDTPVREIADWAEQVYLHRNFRGFRGDRKFIRDDQAQKSFSKLRGAIGGLYNWRLGASKPGSAEHARMLREADFAYRQAFALCPYNPEILFHYVSLLLSPEMQRFDDALLLVKTSQKLDPFNGNIQDLLRQLQDWKAQRATLNPGKFQEELRTNPADFHAAVELASQYFQLGQTNAALEALDRVVNSTNVPSAVLRSLVPVYSALSNRPKLEQTTQLLASRFQTNPTDLQAGLGAAEGYRALHQPRLALQALDQVLDSPSTDPNIVLEASQQLVGLGDYPRLERALDKLTRIAPGSPEAWYDLAALRSIRGEAPVALEALRRALQLSAERRLRDPKARDLSQEVRRDPRFNGLRGTPEFNRLVEGK